MRILIGYQDTRTNREDLALTLYLFLVKYFGLVKVLGVGFCWIYFSIYIGVGVNIPKEYPTIIKLTTKNKTRVKTYRQNNTTGTMID